MDKIDAWLASAVMFLLNTHLWNWNIQGLISEVDIH